MSEDRYTELASLAALGVLDGEDRQGFEAHVATCPACRSELAAYESVAGSIPLALAPRPPRLNLRSGVLAYAGVGAMPVTARAPQWPYWAAAAAVLLGVGLLVVRGQRDEARSRAEQAQGRIETLEGDLRQARQESASLKQYLAEAQTFRTLVAHPESRLASLAGLKDAPSARARIVFNTGSCEAVLLVAGLPRAPEGKGYEVWVISKGAPVPAGVFQVDDQGSAVFRLPVVQETARVKTFAVTVEPAAGTTAPTGPMVLAGAVS